MNKNLNKLRNQRQHTNMRIPTPFHPRRSIPSLTAAEMLLLILTIGVRLFFLPSTSAVPAPYELTRQQIADFRKDGVIVVRGLLEGEALNEAVEAANKIQKSQSWSQRIFHKMFPLYRNLSFQTYRKHKALQKVAFDSTAPTIVAKLMGLDKQNEQGDSQNPRSLRLLKDAVMGFSRGDKGCGWHVDDKHFWPCEDTHQDNSQGPTKGSNRKIKSSDRNTAGINVWITLSPVTAEEGGGLAVAPGSHNLTGRGRVGKLLRKARRTIASGGAQTTCALAMMDPTSHEYMERTKRVYDLQPGDAIIHDRYLFHKPDNFKSTNDENQDTVTKQRISFRYMPSDATYFDNGQSVDAALEHKNMKTGDPLWKGGEYFPQAWPHQLEAEAKASPREDENIFGTKRVFQLARFILTSKAKKE